MLIIQSQPLLELTPPNIGAFGFLLSLGLSVSPGKQKDSESISSPRKHAGAFICVCEVLWYFSTHVHESNGGTPASDLK